MLKKLLSLLLAALLLTSAALAEFDLSAMSDEEVRALYAACAAELALRDEPEAEIWYQNEDKTITLKITGMRFDDYNDTELCIFYELLNASDGRVTASLENVVINGWACMRDGGTKTEAGRNYRGTWQLIWLNSKVGFNGPQDARDHINLLEFDLTLTTADTKTVIPMRITDFSQATVSVR